MRLWRSRANPRLAGDIVSYRRAAFGWLRPLRSEPVVPYRLIGIFRHAIAVRTGGVVTAHAELAVGVRHAPSDVTAARRARERAARALVAGWRARARVDLRVVGPATARVVVGEHRTVTERIDERRARMARRRHCPRRLRRARSDHEEPSMPHDAIVHFGGCNRQVRIAATSFSRGVRHVSSCCASR